MNNYIAGQTVRLYCVFAQGRIPTGQSVTFTDGEIVSSIIGTITDPNTLSLTVRNAAGGGTTVFAYPGGNGTIKRDATGAYYADLNTSTYEGIVSYRWAGLGAVAALQDGQFEVTTGNF